MMAPTIPHARIPRGMLPLVAWSTFSALKNTPEPMTIPTTMQMAVGRPYRFSMALPFLYLKLSCGIPLKGSRRRIPQLCTNCNLFSALFDSSMQKKRPHSGACFFGHAVIFFVSAELLALPLLGTQCPASGPGCRIPQPLGAAGGPASHWCGQSPPAPRSLLRRNA